MKDNNSRIMWVDYAKSIGVFLVILGHLWYSSKYPYVNQLIYSFHMPMFFILSGFVYNACKKINFWEYAIGKFKRIAIPTIFFLILGVIKQYFVGTHSLRKLIKLFIFYEGKCPFNSPCWFFIVLFEIYIFIYLIRPLLTKKLSTLFLTFLFFMMGFALYYFKVFVPFGIDKAFIATGFFTLGILFKQIYLGLKSKQINKNILLALFIPIVIAWFTIAIYNPKVSFYAVQLNNYWYFITTGITGTIVICVISYLISKIRVFKVITPWQDNSIFIVGTHYFFVYDFLQIAGKYNLLFTTEFVFIIIEFTLLLLLLYRPICKFLDKKFPLITGKTK